MMRRFGTPPRRDKAYVRRAGVYVVLLRGSNILLTQEDRSDVGCAPELQLPGGGIDPGEHPITALHREVFEETGWTMSVPRRLGVFRRFTFMAEYDKWADKICTIYVARPVQKLGPPAEINHTAVWVPRTLAASVLTNSGDRHFTEIATSTFR